MIIVRLNGGLGNQMFQYAAAYSLAKFHNVSFKLDIKAFEDASSIRSSDTQRTSDILNFKIQSNLIASNEEIQRAAYPYGVISKIISLYNKKVMKKYNVSWDKFFFEQPNTTYLDGYFQSENFFKKNTVDLLSQFRLKTRENFLISNLLDEINLLENPVSIHVRRGDYISNPVANKIHNICTPAYYNNAIKELRKKMQSFNLVVFSDDIDWVKTNLELPSNPIYLSSRKDIFGGNLTANQELFLMSSCSHNIISNSTFSWWGAYLNDSKCKVIIGPSQWNRSTSFPTNEIIPSSWIRVSID